MASGDGRESREGGGGMVGWWDGWGGGGRGEGRKKRDVPIDRQPSPSRTNVRGKLSSWAPRLREGAAPADGFPEKKAAEKVGWVS